MNKNADKIIIALFIAMSILMFAAGYCTSQLINLTNHH